MVDINDREANNRTSTKTLRTKFNASYVFVDRGTGDGTRISRDPGFSEVYRDEEAIIYRVEQ